MGILYKLDFFGVELYNFLQSRWEKKRKQKS